MLMCKRTYNSPKAPVRQGATEEKMCDLFRPGVACCTGQSAAPRPAAALPRAAPAARLHHADSVPSASYDSAAVPFRLALLRCQRD